MATPFVLVNSSPTNEFKFGRGLQQGDPFSIPFSFSGEGVKCVDECHRGGWLIYWLRCWNSGECYLWEVKSWDNVRSLKDVLMLFEAISCLKINFYKSMLVG